MVLTVASCARGGQSFRGGKTGGTKARGRPRILSVDTGLMSGVKRRRSSNMDVDPFENVGADVDDLKTQIAELKSQVVTMNSMIAELTSRLNGLAGPSPMSMGKPSSSGTRCALYAEVAQKNPLIHQVVSTRKLLHDVSTMEKKSFLAVVENLPDTKDAGQDVRDNTFIRKLCESSSCPPPLEIFRVKCKSDTVYARPLKVRFGAQSDRDTFIKQFGKSLREMASRPFGERTIRARRDMTREELSLLKDLRKEVFTANEKANCIKRNGRSYS